MPPSGLCEHSTHMIHIQEGKILTQKAKISKSSFKMGKWILQGLHTHTHKAGKVQSTWEKLVCINLQGNVIKNSTCSVLPCRPQRLQALSW